MFDYKGRRAITGDVNSQLNEQIEPIANLSITNFKINDSHQGDLRIAVEGKNSVKQFALDVSLKLNDNASFTATGDVDFTEQQPTLDIQLDFEEFKLDAFSPLGEDVFNRIRGYAYGNIHLTGLLENPVMEGDLFLDEAGLYFPYLNVDYDFMGTSVITLKDQVFTFADVTIRDTKYKTKANLQGILKHDHFEKWDYLIFKLILKITPKT